MRLKVELIKVKLFKHLKIFLKPFKIKLFIFPILFIKVNKILDFSYIKRKFKIFKFIEVKVGIKKKQFGYILLKIKNIIIFGVVFFQTDFYNKENEKEIIKRIRKILK